MGIERSSLNERFWRDTKVVVAGANGFIGSHLVRRLVGLGARVHAIARANGEAWRLRGIEGDYRFIESDIGDAAQVKAIFSEVSPAVTFNAAAYGVMHGDQDVVRAIDTNLKGGIHLLEAARSMPCHRFVHLGTRYESFKYLRPVRESDPQRPQGIYGITKSAGQMALETLAREKEATLRTAVLFGVYGPTESARKFVPHAITSMLRGVPLEVTGCEQVRNYTYVEDVAEALLQLAEVETPGVLTVNIGARKSVTLRELIGCIEKVIGCPSDVRFGAVAYRTDEIWRMVPDLRLCRQVLHWAPRLSLMEGMSRTVEWYRNNAGFESITHRKQTPAPSGVPAKQVVGRPALGE